MRKTASLVAVLAVTAAVLPAAALAQPAVTAYLGGPIAGMPYLSDASGGWNRVEIQGTAPTLSQRILSLSPVDTGSNAVGDFWYTDAAGLHGRFYTGRPLHPGVHATYDEALDQSLPGDIGRVVRLAASGLTGLPYSGGTTAAGDSVRFHVLEPGASYPMAHATSSGDTVPNHPARQWMIPAAGDTTTGTLRAAITPDSWRVHVNPRLVSDGDQWTILQAEEYCTRDNLANEPYRVVLMVYSRQYGWDFCLDTMRTTDAAAAKPADLGTLSTWNIVTNSGALRIECPRMMQDPALRQPGDFFTRRITFTVAANGTILPKPSDLLPPINGANDTPVASGTWTEALRMVPPSLPVQRNAMGRPKWTPYLITATGTNAVAWDQNWTVRGSFPIDAGGRARDSDAVQTFTPLVATGPPVPCHLYVSGGGDASAAGMYSYTAIANGQPAYSNTAGYTISWDPAQTRWHVQTPAVAELSHSAANVSLPASGWSGGYAVTAVASPVPILQGRVGRGVITVQWRKAPLPTNIQDGASAMAAAGTAVTNMCYYHTGAEWQYANNAIGAVAVGNAGVASAAVGMGPVRFAGTGLGPGAAFLSSRLQVSKTMNLWAHGDGTAAGSTEIFFSTYPRIVVGTLLGGVVTSPEFAPGTTSPARTFSVLNSMPGSTMHRCRPEVGGCGTVFVGAAPATCPFCGTDLTLPGAVVNVGPGESGVYGTALQAAGLSQAPVSALATVPGSVDPSSHGQRFALPDSAVRFGPADLFPGLGADTSGNATSSPTALMPPGTTPTNLTAQVDIPRYQTPSVPWVGQPWVNDYAGDQGYAGSRMILNDLSAGTQSGYAVTGANPLNLPVGAVIDMLPPGYDAGSTPGITRFAGNGRWDQYYRCPDCGRLHPGVPGCPQDCVALQYSGAGIAYGPVAAGATPPPCPGHRFCTTCGNCVTIAQANTAFAAGLITAPNQCPFCGGATTLVPAAGAGANHVMSEGNLEAEEFDILGLQVSVARKLEVATDQPSVDLGRVSPGVSASYPDTTVRAAGVGVPFGADASLPVLSSAGNAGNVFAPMQPSNIAAGAGAVANAQIMARADMDPARYLRAGLLSRYPIYTGSLSTWATQGAALGQLAMPSQEPGIPTSASNWLAWQAGIADPLRLGLPVGAYRGSMYAFADVYRDGVLRFWRKSTGALATTATTPFDPAYDIPLQPIATSDMQTRVTESRLPANDYYSDDNSPTARFVTSGGNRYLQVIWTTNRPTLAASTAPPAASTSPYPYNLVYTTTAAGQATPAGPNPFLDGYFWGAPPADPAAITNDTVAANAGSVNASPSALADSNGNSWLVWYRRLNHAGGTQSTLEFSQAGASSPPFPWAAPGRIYSTGLTKEHLRGFAQADNGLQWYFWDSGTGAERNIWYRWQFSGAPDNHESVLPIANGVGPEVRSDFATATYAGGDQRSVRKPSHSPFVYTSNPCPLEMLDGTEHLVSVFFSGYARSTQTSDICWTQYDRDQLALPANWRTSNFGKRAFARITDNPYLPPVENYTTGAAQRPGEEFHADGLRQVFNSRHLDWQVQEDAAGNDFGRDSASSGAVSDPAAWNPKFYLGIITDNPGDGIAPRASMYRVSWNSGQDTYDRRRGTYVVVPTLTYVSGGDVLGGAQLQDPNAANTAGRAAQRVTLEVDPAAGTLRFSAPLFNADNVADPACVFNTTSLNVNPALVDVKLYGSYTPYVYRVTNSGGADDCPNAFWETATQRLLVFWRRNYSASQAPTTGRSAILYKTWSLGVPLDHPPATGLTVTTAAGGNYGGSWTLAPGGDFVTFPLTEPTTGAQTPGTALNYRYTGPDGGVQNERHLVLGWSNEMPVPISSVTAESSSLTVIPESPTGNTRYWLFWSSPRAIFYLRPPGSNGQVIHQSSDVFTATVRPESNNLAREVDAGSVDTNTPT